MTTDEARSWLRRGWKINREIDALRGALEEARDRAQSTTVNYEGIVVSGSTSPHRFDRLTELEDCIQERVDELIAIQREIVRLTGRVRDSNRRTLLLLRYVRFKTWEQIAVGMQYSWSQVHRIHADALRDVAEALSKDGIE